MKEMLEKFKAGEAGQVSIEILLMMAVAILFSVSVLIYYTQISDSTLAMELLKVETLKYIDRAADKHTVEKIEYKITPATNEIELCLFTKPSSATVLGASDIADIEDLIENKTAFDAGDVHVSENPVLPTPCD